MAKASGADAVKIHNKRRSVIPDFEKLVNKNLFELSMEKSDIKIDLSESKKKIMIQFDNANSEYKYAVNSYNNAVENLKLAEKIEKKNQIKFLEGLISGLELRQAQIQLYTIQNQLLQSMLEVINKKINLEIILTQN